MSIIEYYDVNWFIFMLRGRPEGVGDFSPTCSEGLWITPSGKF
ncbi:hypothetical protein Barb6_03641 [Bacteroidales bacterium Barb6]|nr:hypothetical protein Barb6_03641 [Bacteroidales bacterium Barb6]